MSLKLEKNKFSFGSPDDDDDDDGDDAEDGNLMRSRSPNNSFVVCVSISLRAEKI